MSDEIEKLIADFSTGSVQEKYDSLRKLIAKRKHHAAIKDKNFQYGIEDLLKTAGDAAVPGLERLLSVATLGRLASSVKRLRTNIYNSLRATLVAQLPDPSLLTEPEDRSYIGNACEQIQPDWGTLYCTHAAIFEETGEQARVAFLKALLVMEPDLASALVVLKKTIFGFVPATEDPGTSVAKRLKRLLAALQIAISETRKEPGEDPGKQLAEVCQAAFDNVPAAKKEESLFEVVDCVATVVHEMVRLRFSLATEANTYSSLKVIKSMFLANNWERFVVKSKAMMPVVDDIAEALLILAKQGITDETLARELSIASGNSENARQRMKQLAKTPGLSAQVKNWLANGKNILPVDILKGESQHLSDDSQLAELLVDSIRFKSIESVSREQILPEIELLAPRLAEGIARLLQGGVALCDAIQTMARRKKLRARGNPGDVEEYAPLEHEVVGDISGVRQVQIIRPVVEQVRENGISFVISKGLAKKIK